MRKFFIIAIGVVTGFLAVVAFALTYSWFFGENLGGEEVNFSSVVVGGHELQAEIANTSRKRSQGLGGRESICRHCAMLFIFPEPGRYPFSMKDMEFKLDFLWIRDGVIVEITENVSPELQGAIIPKQEIDSVLEANGGLRGELRVKVGDKVGFR